MHPLQADLAIGLAPPICYILSGRRLAQVNPAIVRSIKRVCDESIDG